MRYHNITHDDMLNGDGLRTVLWVAGCNHHCKGCQNPDTWDVNGGIPFDESAEEELWEYIDKDYCAGLTLSGGDPMHPDNRKDVLRICQAFRERYGSGKTIWLYTGYLFGEIKSEPALNYVDVIVDGEYIQEKRNVNRHWCGSDNQLVYRKRDDGEWEADKPEETKEQNPGETCGCGT